MLGNKQSLGFSMHLNKIRGFLTLSPMQHAETGFFAPQLTLLIIFHPETQESSVLFPAKGTHSMCPDYFPHRGCPRYWEVSRERKDLRKPTDGTEVNIFMRLSKNMSTESGCYQFLPNVASWLSAPKLATEREARWRTSSLGDTQPQRF